MENSYVFHNHISLTHAYLFDFSRICFLILLKYDTIETQLVFRFKKNFENVMEINNILSLCTFM